MQKIVKSLSDKFAKYDKASLISKLGAIALFPENHSKKPRLRAALQAAICSNSSSEQRSEVNSSILAELLEQHFTPDEQIWQYEDPQEVLFTELIQFHGGNFIVFPEVLADSHTALKFLLDTIFMDGTKFPPSFKQEIYYATSSLLNMSDTIAKRMGFDRYLNSPVSHHDPLFFGNQNLISNACNAIKFQYSKVVGMDRGGLEQRENTINFFICDEKSKFIDGDDFNKNPLQTKPLSKFGDTLIVNQIATIPTSLVHFIISKILEYQINDQFVADYRRVLKNHIEMLFIRLSLKPFKEIPALSKAHPLYGLEILSKIDDDKLIHITIVPDQFKAYNKDIFFTTGNELVSPDVLDRRKEFITEYITNEFTDHKILFLDVYVPIGREYKIVLPKQSFNHLLMNVADLTSIAHHDSGKDKLLLWNYFLAERDVLNHSEIIAFSTLDKYAFYSRNRNSFYFTDDARYPNITLEIGLANDFREEAYRKADPHLVLLNHSDLLAQVERKFPHKEIDIYIPIEPELLPRLYVKGKKLSFWVHINMQHTSEVAVRQVAWSIMEACSYWIWQISSELQNYADYAERGLVQFQFNLIDQHKWANYNYDKKLDSVHVSSLFAADSNEHKININVPFEFAYLINGKNNDNDMVLLEWILKGINSFLECEDALTKLDIRQLIDKYCPVGKKTMILGFDAFENPMLFGHKLPTKRLVSHFHVEQLLNDLAQKAVPGYPLGNLTTPREKNKLCHAVVAYYFKTLQELIAVFPASELIYRTVGLSEELWRAKHIAGAKVTSRLACFGEVSTLRNEILDEGLEIDEASVALRCLIEIIIATPPSGKKTVNNYDIDQMLALSKEIITWGGLSEEINLGINDIELGILPSGRLATGKEFLHNSLRPYNIAKRNEGIDDRIEEEQAMALGLSKNELISSSETESLKNKAYEEEFIYPWDDILDILVALMEYGYQQEDGVMMLRKDVLIKELKEKIEHSEEKIEYILGEFSLKSRSSWGDVPEGCTQTDIYPWRYSRALSYMRKPVLQLMKNEIIYYYWGMRQIILSWQYISDLIDSGRYTYRTKSMGKYIGHMLNIKGKIFTQTVYKWLENNDTLSECIIDHEVKIDIKGKIIADKNLGDIDILIIIPRQKRIISIECKNLNPARITSEFASELKKFESDWIGKHLKRHKWLQNNLAELGRAYSIENYDQYEVRSVFLTSEKVPYPFITKNYKNLPFYDFGTWKRNSSLLYEM